MSVNDDILNAQVRHQVYVQRYSSSVAKQMLSLLEDVDKDLKKQLLKRYGAISSRGFDTGPKTTERLEKMIKALIDLRKRGYKQIAKELRREILEFAYYEADFQYSLLSESVASVGITPNMPSPESIRAATMSRPFQGRLLKDWVKDLAGNSFSELQRQIQIGFVEGESMQQITRRVGRFIDADKRHIEAIVRTAVNHTANAARTEMALGNEDMLKGIKIVATLDSRTSPICRDRDGDIYDVDKGTRPPFHINCRTAFTYVTKSWKELGIDKDELPPSTRSSMNGQVPENLTYYKWLQKQDKGVVADVLGQKKAKLFLEGGLKPDKFSNNGRMLTLKELEKKYPDSFYKAGLK